MDPDAETNDGYWNFSFQEMGQYDLPAIFEFISSNQQHEKLTFIAHSQASSAGLYGMVKFNAAYKKYVQLMIAIAPVARLTNTNSELV